MFEYPCNETIDVTPQIVEEQVMEREAWDIPLSLIAENHLSCMSSQELDDDWRLNDFFGTIAVINLPASVERLQKITQELHDIGTYSFTVFKGIDGRRELDASIWSKLHHNRENIDTSTIEGQLALDEIHKGEAGCYMSHYTLIRQIKEAFDAAMIELRSAQASAEPEAIQNAERKVRQYSRVLILEDDAAFGILKSKTEITKKGSGRILRKALKELPMNWDMLYFVARPKGYVRKKSSHLLILRRSISALAYAVNHTMYNFLIETLSKIEDPEETEMCPVDNAISAIHYLHEVFLITPSIAFQQKGKSDISALYNEHPRQDNPLGYALQQ